MNKTMGLIRNAADHIILYISAVALDKQMSKPLVVSGMKK